MDEYIKRNALLKALDYDPEQRDRVLEGSTFDIILNHPAADVAEVVRCENCTHTKKGHFDIFKWCYCDHWRTEVRKGGFCSNGERRCE